MTVTVNELLSAVNITATEYIPTLIAQEMKIYKLRVSFYPNPGPLLIVAGESQHRDEFFYLQKKWNGERNQSDVFVKIHSRLMNGENFPFLPHHIDVTGLPTVAHPHIYIYSSSVMTEQHIHSINWHHIRTCMQGGDEKDWQQINEARIHEIAQGATVYSVTAKSEYITTPFNPQEERTEERQNPSISEEHDTEMVMDNTILSSSSASSSSSLGPALLLSFCLCLLLDL